jgi:hypothetical protein
VSFAARVPSGSTIEDEETSEDEDFGDSLEEDLESSFAEEEDFPEDFSLDEDLPPFLDEEDLASFSEEEDSSEEGSAEVEELSSPQAANINVDKIKSARNLFFIRQI